MFKDYQKITHGQPLPATGAAVAEWYRETQPSASELLYLLAFALGGEITIENLKDEREPNQ
jgi:hypothetical protein